MDDCEWHDIKYNSRGIHQTTNQMIDLIDDSKEEPHLQITVSIIDLS